MIEIGTKVRFTREIKDGKLLLAKAGETGTVTDLHTGPGVAYPIVVKLDNPPSETNLCFVRRQEVEVDDD